jgi:hypothetical protein
VGSHHAAGSFTGAHGLLTVEQKASLSRLVKVLAGNGVDRFVNVRERLVILMEGVLSPAARENRMVSAGRRAEGNWRETRPHGRA